MFLTRAPPTVRQRLRPRGGSLARRLSVVGSIGSTFVTSIARSHGSGRNCRRRIRTADAVSPRSVKDLIEERLFARRRDLFTRLDLVFIDTTSLYSKAPVRQTLGGYGYSKDHRPDAADHPRSGHRR